MLRFVAVLIGRRFGHCPVTNAEECLRLEWLEQAAGRRLRAGAPPPAGSAAARAPVPRKPAGVGLGDSALSVEEVGDAASLIFFVGAFVALAFGFGAGGLSSWLLVSLLCLRSAWWLLDGTK